MDVGEYVLKGQKHYESSIYANTFLPIYPLLHLQRAIAIDYIHPGRCLGYELVALSARLTKHE